jgi:hypothetical protein
LKNTLERFINFDSVNKIKQSEGANNGRSRLVITAADIQKIEPVIFDSYKTNINIDSIVSCAGYPFYGIKWSINDGKARTAQMKLGPWTTKEDRSNRIVLMDSTMICTYPVSDIISTITPSEYGTWINELLLIHDSVIYARRFYRGVAFVLS